MFIYNECVLILIICVIYLIYLTMTVRYTQVFYIGERLWLRVSSVNDQIVVGRVWGHPVSPGLRFGQMIQIPICDILDDWYIVQLNGL